MQENKFVYNNNRLIDFIQEKIDKHESNYIKNISYEYSDVYLTNHMTECKRRILYRSYSASIDNVNESRQYLIDNNKEYLSNKWINILGKIDDLSVVGEKFRTGESVSNLFGIIDAIIKVKNTNVVFMFHNASDLTSIKENGPKRCDIVDIMLKMWMVKINNGIILYDNGSLGYLIFNVKPYKHIVKSVYKICQDLNNYKIRGILVDRSYKEISTECLSCEYKNKCWNKEV